jgi:hypothetical protein
MMSTEVSPPLEQRPERPAPREDSGKRRDRLLAGVFTVGAHLLVFSALFWPRAAPPSPPVEPAPLQLSLIELPKPAPPAPPDPAMITPAAPQTAARLGPVRIAAKLVANTPPDTSDLLSQSDLAGAASADGAGGGGGGCDMARAVQQALRRDPLVRTSVEGANRLGKSVMLWNGDWVRSGEQEGKGLSAVREAVVWELAFAPQACRNKVMHGLVLLSLADGNTRFAIGAGDWRWSDLLHVRGITATR